MEIRVEVITLEFLLYTAARTSVLTCADGGQQD